jgi:hypothetical protein
MFWMRAYPSLGEVGGDRALEFSSFLGPMKWHRADRRVPFEAHTVGGGRAGELRNLITVLGSLRCIKELNHPAPHLLFSPSTLPILPLQPSYSPPPTRLPHFSPTDFPPFPPPHIQHLLEINSKL